MNRTKWAAALLLAVTLLPALAACTENKQAAGNDGAQAGKGSGAKKVVLKVREDESSGTQHVRMDNVLYGIDKVNKEDKDVELTYEKLPALEGDELVLQFQGGVKADVLWGAESDVGWMMNAKMIQPVDWVAELPAFKTMAKNVKDKITYNGHIYGVPFDLAITPLYINKKALLKLGWTQGDIDALPGKVERGEWTLYDMIDTAKQAIDKGIVKLGFLMDGIDNNASTGLANAFHAYAYDSKTNKLLYGTAWLDYFKWWNEAVNVKKAITQGLPNLSKSAYESMMDGEALFFSDNSGYEAFKTIYGKSDKEFAKFYEDNFIQTLIPSGIKGQPAANMMKIRYMMVYAGVDAEKMGYIKRAADYAFEPERQVLNVLERGKLPPVENIYGEDQVKQFKFVMDTRSYANTADIRPPHPDFIPKYMNYHQKAIESIIVDKASPEAAYEKMKQEIKTNIDASQYALQ